jgi:hypothetical protein
MKMAAIFWFRRWPWIKTSLFIQFRASGPAFAGELRDAGDHLLCISVNFNPFPRHSALLEVV